MKSFIRTAAITLTILTVGVTQARAQTHQCVPSSNDYAVGLRENVRELVTGTHAQYDTLRTLYHLLPANSGQVSIVTQASKCQDAGAAFEGELSPPLATAAEKPPVTPAPRTSAAVVSRNMIVIKVHTSRYVISDVNYVRGEWRTAFVTDQNFNVLGSFLY